MNPYSEDEMKYFNQIRQMVGDQLLTRIAPSMEEIERVNTYGAYEQPKWIDEKPFLRDQLERWGVFNLVRGLNERGDRSMTALGAVSPRSMIRVDKMPEHVRPVYSPDDKLEQLMELAWMGPSDIGMLGWTAFHGTPHKWAAEARYPGGRPRLDMVGRGEGAAAYGHGWYGADVPEVSNSYRGFDGRKTRRAWDNGKYYVVENDAQARRIAGPFDTESAAQEAENKMHGFLYEIDIPDDVAPKLLDWDKPLYQQSEDVKKALQPVLDELVPRASQDRFYKHNGQLYSDDTTPMRWTGEILYRHLTNDLTGKLNAKAGGDVFRPDDKIASEYLASIGIPGNKYFDAMSRDKGQGTYNYVIWDQDVLNRTVPLSINDQPTGLKPGDYPLSAQDVLNQLQP